MQHHPKRENESKSGKGGEIIRAFWRAGRHGLAAGYTLPSSWPCTRHEFGRLNSGRNNSLYPFLRFGLNKTDGVATSSRVGR